MNKHKRGTLRRPRQVGESFEEYRARRAWALRELIGPDVERTLGLDDFETHGEIAPVLSFTMPLLPFNAPGVRSETRDRVRVLLYLVDGQDKVDLYAFRYAGGVYLGHCTSFGMHVSTLRRFLLGMDYDGPEVTRPGS